MTKIFFIISDYIGWHDELMKDIIPIKENKSFYFSFSSLDWKKNPNIIEYIAICCVRIVREHSKYVLYGLLHLKTGNDAVGCCLLDS